MADTQLSSSLISLQSQVHRTREAALERSALQAKVQFTSGEKKDAVGDVTAVLVIHGMGQQLPFETLDGYPLAWLGAAAGDRRACAVWRATSGARGDAVAGVRWRAAERSHLRGLLGAIHRGRRHATRRNSIYDQRGCQRPQEHARPV